MLKFDDVLQYVGEFGLYQKRVYLLLCMFCISHGTRMLIMVFTLYLPKHRCAIPNYIQDTYDMTSLDHEKAFNMSIPAKESCHIFQPGNYTYDHYNRPINATLEKCDDWVYDTSTIVSTVTSQFDLVCEHSAKRSVASMTFYGGYLIGVLVLGAVSDMIGRKMCLYLSLSLLIILGTGLAFANSFIAFAIINFFVGSSTAGIFTSVFVIGIELVGPSKRIYTGMFTHLFFSIGVVTLAGIAYLIKEWHYIQIAITAPLVLSYFMWCFIPESARWQIQKGHYAKARATVEKLVAVNKTKVPEHVLEDVMPSKDVEEQPMLNGLHKNPSQLKNKQENKDRLIDLFKNRVLFLWTGIIFFNWMVVSMTFYGLNFNTGNLGVGSIYLNLFLAGLVEFPAHITTIFTVDRVGRKIVHSSMLIISGIACLLCVCSIIYAPKGYEWVTVALAMLGKFGVAGGYGTIYLYSTEFYPTVIRNSAVGASSSCARIGAMLAPYIAAQGAQTDAFGRSIPLLICGILILIAGASFLTLPETLNRKLPETIADAKNFIRSHRKLDVIAPVDQPSPSKAKLTLGDEITEI